MTCFLAKSGEGRSDATSRRQARARQRRQHGHRAGDRGAARRRGRHADARRAGPRAARRRRGGGRCADRSCSTSATDDGVTDSGRRGGRRARAACMRSSPTPASADRTRREPDDRFDDLVATNLIGTYSCCRAAEPHLEDGGRIVVIGVDPGPHRRRRVHGLLRVEGRPARARSRTRGRAGAATDRGERDLPWLGRHRRCRRPGFESHRRRARRHRRGRARRGDAGGAFRAHGAAWRRSPAPSPGSSPTTRAGSPVRRSTTTAAPGWAERIGAG